MAHLWTFVPSCLPYCSTMTLGFQGLSIKRHMALVIWKLPNTDSLCFIINQFSVGQTTKVAMQEACNAILAELGPHFTWLKVL